MRIIHLVLLSCVLLPLAVSSATGSEQTTPEQAYPGEVSLQATLEGKERYVMAHSNVRLYVYEKDSPGKSNCTGGCAHAWPPLTVGENDGPMGNWTVVQREDGLEQWAYKGQPVYLYYHDSASDPQGYKPSQGWHYLEP